MTNGRTCAGRRNHINRQEARETQGSSFYNNNVRQKLSPGQAWWLIPVISTLRTLRQEDHKIEPAWAT
jgi:hypothetical protein